jgi:chloride channel protein, CIC family
VSFFISARLQPEPIYEALANQDGIHLPTEGARRRYGQQQVVHVMRAPTDVLPAPTTVEDAFKMTHGSQLQAWPVTDDRGVVGVVSRERIEQALAKGETKKALRDLIDARDFPHVHADHPLYVALERMGTAKLDLLPVVSRADIHYLIGVVVLADVLNSYGVKHRESSDLGT